MGSIYRTLPRRESDELVGVLQKVTQAVNSLFPTESRKIGIYLGAAAMMALGGVLEVATVNGNSQAFENLMVQLPDLTEVQTETSKLARILLEGEGVLPSSHQ